MFLSHITPVFLALIVMLSGNLFAEITLHLKVKPKAQLALKAGEQPVPVVFLNEPFSVVLKTESSSQYQKENIIIKNLEKFSVISQNETTTMQMMNGSRLIQNHLTLEVVAKQEGEQLFGPAKVIIQGKEYSSTPVTVHVVKRPADFRPQEIIASGVDLIPELSLPSKELVIGQQIPLTVFIKSRGPIIGGSMQLPQFKGFTHKMLAEEACAPEIINGNQYEVKKQIILLTALQEGPVTIEPVSVVFEYYKQDRLKNSHRQQFFSNLFELASGLSERQQVNSQELSLIVHPLPEQHEQKEPCHAVGSFDTFSLQLDRLKTSINEPLTLTMSIQGAGNLDIISTPELQLPKGFKCYESQSSVKEIRVTPLGMYGKKSIEFVLQIPRAGTYELPEQQFTFYDPQEKKYKTLTSAPLTVVISKAESNQEEQSIARIQQNEPKNNSSEDTNQPDDTALISDEIAFVTDEYEYSLSDTGLHWGIVLFFIILPMLLLLLYFQNTVKYYFYGDKLLIQEKIQELHKLLREEKIEQLHDCFKELIALQYHQEANLLTEDAIVALLENDKYAPDQIEAFVTFMNKCAEAHFLKNSIHSLELKNLINQGNYWITFLQKKQ